MICINRINYKTAAFLTTSAIALAAISPASAQTNYVCTAWNVDRGIEVVAPDDSSAVCQVVYRKPDEDVADKILWRSTQSMTFCNEKARGLAARLSAAGFNCGEGK
ncbi:MAG: hypothetical protein GXP04_15330, partial [Alphaproteobacteria bacterium]|nr:hypothetical protein [Alphaproteobacteria bacterium]